MKLLKYIVALVIGIGVFIWFGIGNVAAEKETVIIEEGDTLWSISVQYRNVTVNDLYKLNPDIDATNLQVGTEIVIGFDPSVEMYHIVVPEDTLYSIAKEYSGVIVDDLYELNPNIDPMNLQPWTKVQVSKAHDSK